MTQAQQHRKQADRPAEAFRIPTRNRIENLQGAGHISTIWWCVLAVVAALAALLGTYPLAQHGFRAAYFRSVDWSGEPEWRLDPLPSATGAELALGPVPPQTFSVYWVGYVAVDHAGPYRVETTTSSSCRTFVDDTPVPDSRERVRQLEQGVHALTVKCSTTKARLDVDMWWTPADRHSELLRPEVVFPSSVTFTKYQRLVSFAQAQRIALAAAGALLLLLSVDWARGRGAVAWAIVGVTLVTVVAVHADWPSFIRGPAEWRWGYQQGPNTRSIFPAMASGLAILAMIGAAGTRVARRAPRRFACGLVAAGLVVGLAFQLSLNDTEPGGWRQSLVDRVWSGNGYLRSAALTSNRGMLDLLRHYPQIMPTLSLHGTVHPPGGTLMYRPLIWLARRAGVAGVDPAFAFGSAHVAGAAPLALVALAGGAILAACATLTAVPVALAVWLLRRDALHAAAVGLLWLLVAGPNIFVPQLDQLDTLLVALSFVLLLWAQSPSRHPTALAAASGLMAGASMFFSYGNAPTLGAAVLMCAYGIDEANARQRFVTTTAWWMGGAAAATFAPMLVGFPVIGAALTGLSAHKAFTTTRSAWIWQRFNLLDFSMFFGGLSLAVAVSVVAQLLRGGGARGRPPWRLTALACLAILLTDLSDTARGEVGRMWMPFMPLLFAAVWSAPACGSGEPMSFSERSRDAVIGGALMLVYCIVLRLHWYIL
jgi:hypothetical protein